MEVNSHPDGPAALPRAVGRPPLTKAVLKATPEDFVVDEEPAYLPTGTGDHLFVRFEKVGLDTEEAVKRIARAIGVDPRECGFAGRKDRHAVTRQWMSLPCPAKAEGREEAVRALDLPQIRVLEAARHGNKLRTGHLRGNAFELVLRDAEGDLEAVGPALALLVGRGLPAYYGEQRFGRRNLERARAWLVEGSRAPHPGDRKFLVSVLQSAIFNDLCAARLAMPRGLATIVAGDLARKEDSGGLFVVEDVAEAQARADRFELSATGPMFGPKMRWPAGEAAELERAALARHGLDEAALARFGRDGEGTRRPYRVPVRPLAEAPLVAAEGPHLRLRFWLPAGAYATTLVHELCASVSQPGPA
jgi:tRNA pseudouridine13 synthase